jgi:HlyD family type I secretion membrane fusion protein
MSVFKTPIHPASIQLVEAHRKDISRLTITAGVILFLGMAPAMAWVALAPLASAVVAPAVVKIDLNRRPVQHAEGGIVAEVKVRDGQRVSKGEPLIILGDVGVSADLERLGLRVRAEEATIARLEAEQAGRSSIVFPKTLLEAAQSEQRLQELLSKERSLFSARREALTGQVGLLRSQRGKVEQELAALDSQVSEASRSLGHQREELQNNRWLLRDGFISGARVSQNEASVADYGVKLAERRSELARAEQRRIDIDLRIRSLESDYRQQASDQLKVTAQRLSELREELRKPADAAARQVIVAPADGEVMDLKFTSVGSVIAPRETIADIVPSAPKLLVEAQLRPEDIEQVRRGQPADVRFTAFNPRTTPSVAGQVSYVSADRLIDETTRQPYYLAQIEIDPESMARAGSLVLQAGMPAEVYLLGRERTTLEYLAQPVTDVLRRSVRER